MKVYIRETYNKITQKILNFLKLFFCKIFKSLLDKAWIRINNKGLEFDNGPKSKLQIKNRCYIYQCQQTIEVL